MVEAVQVMTMVFQASRKMKEKMDSRPSFWGVSILIYHFFSKALIDSYYCFDSRQHNIDNCI